MKNASFFDALRDLIAPRRAARRAEPAARAAQRFDMHVWAYDLRVQALHEVPVIQVPDFDMHSLHPNQI